MEGEYEPEGRGTFVSLEYIDDMQVGAFTRHAEERR
jgi:hypothetical protein